MKKCPSCQRLYDNQYNYCLFDGTPLKKEKTKSKIGLYLLIALSVVVCITGLLVYINKRNSQFEKSHNQIELNKYIKMLSDYIEENSGPSTFDLKITNDNWKKERNYVYVTGSVKNTGDTTISYYKISVDFYDSRGNIVDSDWTNGIDLKAGASRHFEIMHKNDISFKSYKVTVDEVR